VLTNETRPRAFDAEMLAPRPQKRRLRTMGEELETMVELLSEMKQLVVGMLAE
jgi:hypothetical protein